MSIFDTNFDEDRRRLYVEIDSVVGELKHGVIYGDWWQAEEAAIARDEARKKSS